MKFSNRAVLTAVLSALVAVAVFLGTAPMLGVVAVLMVAFALGWSHLLRLPAVGGSTLVVVLAGMGALGAVAATDGEPWLRHVPIVLAMAVFLSFINEMLRPVPREDLLESVIGTISGAIISVSAVGWLATVKLDGGEQLAVAASVGLATAAAVSALPLARNFVLAAMVVFAAVAGLVVAVLMPELSLVSGAVIGACSGLVLLTVNTLFGKLPSIDSKHAWLSVFTLPIMIVGIFMYTVGRILV